MQGALNWLEENQDKSLEELQAGAASTAKADDDEEDDGSGNIPEGAKSLVCNDCGKRFRNGDLAAFHASKTSVSCPVLSLPVPSTQLTLPQSAHRLLRIYRRDCPSNGGREEAKVGGAPPEARGEEGENGSR